MTGRGRSACRGMSLVETAIAATGTVIVFGIVALGSRTTVTTWNGRVTATELERRAQGAIERIVGALADASRTTIADDLAAPTGGSSITFQARTGYAGGADQLGPATTIAWERDPGDADDGADNDGDGLVDEGQIVLRKDGGHAVVLARNVAELLAGESGNGTDDNGNGLEDEAGLAFELHDGRVHVWLTLAKVGPDGALVTRSAESVVRLLD